MPRVKAGAAPAPKPAPAATNYPVLKDKAVAAAVEKYCAAKATLDAAKSILDELKPVIVAAMGGAPTAYCGARVLSHSVVPPLPETPNVVVTREMVGSVIPGKRGKAGYEMLRVH